MTLANALLVAPPPAAHLTESGNGATAGTAWMGALATLPVVASIPFGLRPAPGGLVVVQVGAVLTIGLVVLVRVLGGRSPLRTDPWLLWAAAFVAVALGSVAWAVDPGRALKQAISLGVALTLACAVMSACRCMAAVRLAATTIVLSGAVVCANSLRSIDELSAAAGARRVDNRLHGAFSEPNQFGLFAAVILVLGLGVLMAARGRVERVIAGAGVVSAALSLALALSRGAWIGAALALALFAVLVPRARAWLALSALGVLAVVAAAISGGISQGPLAIFSERVSTLQAPLDNPYDNRPAIWRRAAVELQQQPWHGLGADQFGVVSPWDRAGAASAPAEHAHSTLLTVAVELGLPTVLLVMGLTFAGLWRGQRAARSWRPFPDGPLVGALAAALAVVVGQGLVDFTLRNASVLMTLALLLGLFLAATRLPSPGHVAHPTEPMRS